MILDLFYVSLVVFAIIAIQTAVLRNAIIYLSVFSLLCSIVYLFSALLMLPSRRQPSDAPSPRSCIW